MFNVVEELFAPGRQHTEDERQKMTLVVDDVGDADPSKGPIDLSSGTVVVKAPQQQQDTADQGQAGPVRADPQDSRPGRALPPPG
ncbi:DUF6191 domain-containing protein [Streptomyces sp. NBC_01456]|uniref:DUF6191 domain-containing protein n=1 Tax=unclassified Streptomyces TaxID=2593676 RepID=UPI002E317132|nr:MULTISPECIES: DUF6191 domain-containing protein [unclassified Streptomyces]